MKITDIITEAASPAQQAAIAISMKKAGKKPKQGVAEAVAPSQYAKLYHSTPAIHLDGILQSGYLAPTGREGYLSLTRDSKLDYGSWGGEFIEFDIDQNAVRQRIKLEPYVDQTTQTGARAAGRGESEERTRQKIPLKGFVTAMHAPTGWEGDKAGEYYGGLLKKYGVPIIYDIVPKLEEQGMAEHTELTEEFDLIESIVEMIAEHNGVDAEVVWADLESLTEDELYVFAVTSDPLMEDWQKANKRDKTDGMSQKAVNAYRRENPGSKLKTAVTTKPSKLKKGGKASKRRKSYCSRSRGQMKMHSISCAKTPDKAICKARRRWNC